MRLNVAGGVARDGAVDRQRAFVEEVERPNVEGAAGEVDAGGGYGVDSHLRLLFAFRCP